MPTRRPTRQLNRLLDFLLRENFHRLLLVMTLLILLGGIGLSMAEPERSFADSIWWSIVTLTTVGFGDISPTSLLGRLIGVVLMFFGIGILGMFTATVAGLFVERRLRKERGMGSYDFDNHIILCEWNDHAHQILNDLRRDPRSSEAPVVLLAELDIKPIQDANLHFVQGAVTEENLKRCNLDGASTVVILGDRSLEPNARDAKAVLSTLAVESINPEVYTIVELQNEDNAKHCERARADEIIVSSDFSSRLISSAALDHGITRVMSELLSAHYGSAMILVAVPSELEGKTFLEVFSEMKRAHNQTAVAIEQQATGQVVTNPASETLVEPGDKLFVIVSTQAVAGG